MAWFNLFKEKGKGSQGQSALNQQILRAAADIKGMENLDAACRYFNELVQSHEDFVRIDSLIFRCEDVMLNVGK